MIRERARRMVVVAAIAVTSCVTATAAYAGTAYGAWVNLGTIGGRTYEHRASVTTKNAEPGGARGTAWIRTAGGALVPADLMGAQASLFKNGALCTDTAWSYNTGSTSGWSQSTPNFGDCGAGSYVGDGQVMVKRPGSTPVMGYPLASPPENQN